MRNRCVVFSFVTLLSFVVVAAHRDPWVTLQGQVRILRDELVRQGAHAFVTNRATTPSIAPHIHSKCWVDWLPRTNATQIAQVAYEEEKRNFGLDFVGELEKLALPDIPLADFEAQERYAAQMLDIAEWLKTSKGYGNQILKKWSEGIALTAIGGMSVNMDCSTNRVLRLLARVDNLQENLVRRVAILNEEAPHPFRLPKGNTENDTMCDLERQWLARVRATIEYDERRDGGLTFRFRDAGVDYPHRFAFYLPDNPYGTMYGTVRDTWGMKRHEVVCVYGLFTRMYGEIFEILRWRQAFGQIPRPSAAEIEDEQQGFNYRLRLHDAWQKMTNFKEMYFLGASAILKIYGGEFQDDSTHAQEWDRDDKLGLRKSLQERLKKERGVSQSVQSD